MSQFQQFCVLGRGKASWVTDLLNSADKHESLAYIVFFVSLFVFILLIVLFGFEWRKLKNSQAAWDKFATMTLQALLAISIPAILLFSLASRLFG